MVNNKKYDLTTPIVEFRFHVKYETYKDIESLRIFTLGDLVSLEISRIINHNLIDRFSKLEIVYLVHSLGYKFKDETVLLNTKDHTQVLISLDTPLEQLSSLISSRTFKGLRRAGVNVLRDLVSKNKSDLLAIQHFGQKSLNETILFVHLLGFELAKKTSKELQTSEKTQEESIYLNASLDEFKDRLSSRAYNLLRRQNINTINDLITRSIPEISEIRNMGSVILNEIVGFVHSLGLAFVGDKTIQNNEIRVLETKIVEEKKRKTEITSRIVSKENLLKRYNYLIREKQKLMKQEEELDEQIRQALANLKPLEEKEKQKLK